MLGGAVEGRKSATPIDKARGLYITLYYRTSCDYSDKVNYIEKTVSSHPMLYKPTLKKSKN